MSNLSNDMESPLLSVQGLKIHFPVLGGVLKRQIGAVRAVDDVSFTIQPGETWGSSANQAAGNPR